MSAYAIRQYCSSDLEALYKICLETGADGTDATGKIDDDLLGHIYVAPYCKLEPDSAFVLTKDGEPVGYIVGTIDTSRFILQSEAEWWPALRQQYPCLPNPSTWGERVINGMHRVEEPPSFVDSYPAHLHINILPPAQGLGQGRALMDHFLTRLYDQSVAGVHLEVSWRNEQAIAFYRRYGLVVLGSTSTGVYFGKALLR